MSGPTTPTSITSTSQSISRPARPFSPSPPKYNMHTASRPPSLFLGAAIPSTPGLSGPAHTELSGLPGTPTASGTSQRTVVYDGMPRHELSDGFFGFGDKEERRGRKYSRVGQPGEIDRTNATAELDIPRDSLRMVRSMSSGSISTTSSASPPLGSTSIMATLAASDAEIPSIPPSPSERAFSIARGGYSTPPDTLAFSPRSPHSATPKRTSLADPSSIASSKSMPRLHQPTVVRSISGKGVSFLPPPGRPVLSSNHSSLGRPRTSRQSMPANHTYPRGNQGGPGNYSPSIAEGKDERPRATSYLSDLGPPLRFPSPTPSRPSKGIMMDSGDKAAETMLSEGKIEVATAEETPTTLTPPPDKEDVLVPYGIDHGSAQNAEEDLESAPQSSGLQTPRENKSWSAEELMRDIQAADQVAAKSQAHPNEATRYLVDTHGTEDVHMSEDSAVESDHTDGTVQEAPQSTRALREDASPVESTPILSGAVPTDEPTSKADVVPVLHSSNEKIAAGDSTRDSDPLPTLPKSTQTTERETQSSGPATTEPSEAHTSAQRIHSEREVEPREEQKEDSAPVQQLTSVPDHDEPISVKDTSDSRAFNIANGGPSQIASIPLDNTAMNDPKKETHRSSQSIVSPTEMVRHANEDHATEDSNIKDPMKKDKAAVIESKQSEIDPLSVAEPLSKTEAKDNGDQVPISEETPRSADNGEEVVEKQQHPDTDTKVISTTTSDLTMANKGIVPEGASADVHEDLSSGPEIDTSDKHEHTIAQAAGQQAGDEVVALAEKEASATEAVPGEKEGANDTPRSKDSTTAIEESAPDIISGEPSVDLQNSSIADDDTVLNEITDDEIETGDQNLALAMRSPTPDDDSETYIPPYTPRKSAGERSYTIARTAEDVNHADAAYAFTLLAGIARQSTSDPLSLTIPHIELYLAWKEPKSWLWIPARKYIPAINLHLVRSGAGQEVVLANQEMREKGQEAERRRGIVRGVARGVVGRLPVVWRLANWI